MCMVMRHSGSVQAISLTPFAAFCPRSLELFKETGIVNESNASSPCPALTNGARGREVPAGE